MRLFHVSEEADIAQFVPRTPHRDDMDKSKALVWALNECCLPNYIRPVHKKMIDTSLYIYEFDVSNFYIQDETAGYYVSEHTEIPISVTKFDNLYEELFKRNVEVRLLNYLDTLDYMPRVIRGACTGRDLRKKARPPTMRSKRDRQTRRVWTVYITMQIFGNDCADVRRKVRTVVLTLIERCAGGLLSPLRFVELWYFYYADTVVDDVNLLDAVAPCLFRLVDNDFVDKLPVRYNGNKSKNPVK